MLVFQAEHKILMHPFHILGVGDNKKNSWIYSLFILYGSPYLGPAGFIVHHIHAFTIHVALLILLKGILYARNLNWN